MSIPKNCKRLAEVDMPIATISDYCGLEKDIKTGNVSAIHVWWARRPLAACRAMNLSCLLPDPADPNCTNELRKALATALDKFERQPSKSQSRLMIEKTWSQKDDGKLSEHRNRPEVLRKRLMHFIGEYSNWELKQDDRYAECARDMVIHCHDGNPVLLDPFAGGGSIPLEGIRIGAESYATDLNPIPILLNKLQLECLPNIPDYVLLEAEKEAMRINAVLERELGKYYPIPNEVAQDEAPIGYLCARWVQCEGVGCGARFPLLSSTWVVNSKKNKICYSFERGKTDFVKINLIKNPKNDEVPPQTVSNGNATCPICGHRLPASSVKRQLLQRKGGADDSELLLVISTNKGSNGRVYRLPYDAERKIREQCLLDVDKLKKNNGYANFIPNEDMPVNSRYLTPPFYGAIRWVDLYTPRQLITQIILAREVTKIIDPTVRTILALSASKFTDRNTSLCRWNTVNEKFLRCFSIQTVQMTWDFFEPVPYGEGGPNWKTTYINVIRGIENARVPKGAPPAKASFADAQNHPIPDDYVDLWATDPPYYDSVPYSDISNYFVVWLRRMLPNTTLEDGHSPKDAEVVMDGTKTKGGEVKDAAWYEKHVEAALREGRRVTKDDGIAYWVYAHKSTEGWSTVLKGIINAGWKVTGSWPISTERVTRLRAQRSAALETSVHIVMRPRDEDSEVGNWSDILDELPKRINAWLHRLTSEGVYGADAIFACIGPAMELYSRWRRVEKADGSVVSIDDYLKIVWDTVASEAMKIIDSETSSGNVEDDARFSMMVLWTLRQSLEAPNGELVFDEDVQLKESKPSSSDLPFDTASLLARGIGVNLDKLAEQNVIIYSKKQNTKFVSLLSPADRRHYLLGGSNGKPTSAISSERVVQLKIGEDLYSAQSRQRSESIQKSTTDVPKRDSTLDQLHQAMLLFADGNSAALDRLIKDTIGDNKTAWQLAQTLDTLYPEGSWERSKIEGVIDTYKSIFRKG